MLVVKIGGSIFANRANLIADFAAYAKQNKAILCHGGAAESTELAKKTGVETKYLTNESGMKWRYSTAQQLELMQMTLAGKINKTLVAELQKLGVNAIGLSGLDGALLCARQKIVNASEIGADGTAGKLKVVRDDFTGKIDAVNSDLLSLLISNGYTPVIAPLALSENFEPLNTHGDRAAAQIASAMRANALAILTDVDGYFDPFPTNLVKRIDAASLPSTVQNASGGMKRKLVAAQEALGGGVKKVLIANGTKENPLTGALNGNGTTIE
ncbi:[LysW]-aminoadipate kinase [Candidatus Micrarchaeota archaeon]|nr:[LysW]-aminoadipate kinase [Candidatus Micrarchaeota archaeon]